MQITQALLKVQHGLSLPLEPAHWALPIGLRLALSACPLSLTLQLAHVQYTCLNLADTPLACQHAVQLFECSDSRQNMARLLVYVSLPACYYIYSCQPLSGFQSTDDIQYPIPENFPATGAGWCSLLYTSTPKYFPYVALPGPHTGRYTGPYIHDPRGRHVSHE